MFNVYICTDCLIWVCSLITNFEKQKKSANVQHVTENLKLTVFLLTKTLALKHCWPYRHKMVTNTTTIVTKADMYKVRQNSLEKLKRFSKKSTFYLFWQRFTAYISALHLYCRYLFIIFLFVLENFRFIGQGYILIIYLSIAMKI